MIDVFNIPSSTQNTITFYATGNWQTWNKPRNAKFIEIFCLGGGGGGARVNGGTTTNGGGGGSSAGIVRGLIPAFLLPDTIYILVGKGGAGAATTNTAGGSGGISYVGLQPLTSEQTLICKSSTTVSNGGSNNGTGGGANTISTVSLSAFGNLGLFTAIAGVAGSSAGGSQAALSTNIVTGGAAGGSKTPSTFAVGGNITSASVLLTSQVNGGVASGQNGDSGYGNLQPFCGTGGAGGAGSLTTGGRGGDGWYGCGGGGGGAGSTGTAGNGGNGGDGLVIITVIS